MLKGKIVATLLVWACVGFNSSLAVQKFLGGETNHLVSPGTARDAKLVTMPNVAEGFPRPSDGFPLFEVFIPNPSRDVSFDPNTIPDGIPCHD